jgi:hypothetical protein
MEIDNETLLYGLDETDINSILLKYSELVAINVQLNKLIQNLEIKIKNFMKDKKWNDYRFEDISVKLTRVEKQTLDQDKLKLAMTKQQLDAISKYAVDERITVTNKQHRDNMANILNVSKDKKK